MWIRKILCDAAVDRGHIPAREVRSCLNTFPAGKSRRLYKTLICSVALQTAPLNIYLYTPRAPAFLRALHLSIFEQPQTSGSRNIIFDLKLEI